MNLRQLEHVVALAEEGGFARAANRVHLSQPALTRSIQSIEEALEVVLFDRTTREIRITAAGEMVVQRARRVLFEARCLVRDVNLLRTHDIGSVSFGAGPYPAALMVPAALKALARSHPGLKVAVSVDSYANLLAAVRAEKLDFLVVDIRGAMLSTDLAVIALEKQPASWFVREGHPLAQEREVDTRQLHDYPIVSVPLPGLIRDGLRKWLRLPPNREIEFHVMCNDVNVLQEYARETDALLLLTDFSLAHARPIPGLVPLRMASRSPLSMHFGIVHLAGRTLAPAAEQAILAIQRATDPLVVAAD